MVVKERENTRDRVSVTTKPSTAKLIEEMTADDNVTATRNDIFTIGVDVLHYVWSVLKAGGQIGVKMPGDEEFQPVQFFIPGMRL